MGLDPTKYPSKAVSDTLDGKHLPIPGTRHAPDFNATPGGIKKYFNALDWIFPANKVTDTELQIEVAVSYVDEDIRTQWMAMPEYAAGAYPEFKKAIMESYGIGADDRRYTTRELEENLNLYRSSQIYNKASWVEFKRVIMHVMLYLINNKDITEKYAIDQIISCILGPAWASVQVELKRAHPESSDKAKAVGLRWTLEEVVGAISTHFGDMNVFGQTTEAPDVLSGRTYERGLVPVSTSRVKTEDLSQQNENLALLMDRFKIEAKEQREARLAQEQLQVRHHEQLLAAFKEIARGNQGVRTQHVQQYDYASEPISYPYHVVQHLAQGAPNYLGGPPTMQHKTNPEAVEALRGINININIIITTETSVTFAVKKIYKPNGVKFYFLRNGVSVGSKAKAGIWPAWQVWKLMEKMNGKLPPEASAMIKTQNFAIEDEEEMFSPQTMIDQSRGSETQANFD
ncbi:hypothetical protein BDZ89DRAFT_1144753 [Hymenopellis radicata]|nr:hypothetical protein BDZ89DRAFT_1144753 [Hymenopellis radicata]